MKFKTNAIRFLFISILGVLLHFTYEWSDQNRIVGLFSAVNESTWEHLKLIFWPAVLFAAAEYFAYGRKTDGFIPVRVTSIITGMASVVVLFYTYSGILGRNILVMDILVFIISVAVMYVFLYYKLRSPGKLFTMFFSSSCEVSVIAAICILMVIFIYDPPEIGMFQDPLSGGYGIGK